MKQNKSKNLISKRKKLGWLNLISFLLGFQMALALYILSSFLKERSGMENVSIFYLLGYLASLSVLLKLYYLIRKYGASKIFLLFLTLKVVALLGMGIFSQNVIGIIFAVGSMMFGALTWVGLDIFIEKFSQNKTTGKTRGLQLTTMNAGILLAPFIATWLVARWEFQSVFFIASGIVVLAGLVALTQLKNETHKIEKDIKIKTTIKKLFRRKNIFRIYYLALLLDFFYAVTTVFVPLYLLSQGVSWGGIGIILTCMLIPFVILQYPLGILADKRTGEKEWLLVAIILMAVFTGVLTFIHSSGIIIWAVVLFMTRVGAAIMEVMRDSYFYKKINAKDVDLIDLFRTTRSLAYITSMIISGLFLLIFPLSFIFIILALIILTGLVPLQKLKDTK